MNLLSVVDWREYRRELHGGSGLGPVPAPVLIDVLSRRRLLADEIDLFDLGHLAREPDGDSEMAALLNQCHVAVIADTGFPQAVPDLDEPGEVQADIWMEAHSLQDGRQLMIPGDSGRLPNVSFWRTRLTDQRLGVVSFVVGADRQVARALFRRNKACLETYDTTDHCGGTPGGCQCELRRRERNGVVRLRCVCAR
jgi:hypothetical protein